MSGGSKTAVYTAIGANGLITLAKGAGFFATGSGAMLAEAIHSAADVGNQALLAFGLNRAARPADALHPFGYGREAFVWALISAVGIFFIGCGVTVAHGVHTLMAEGAHEVGSTGLALGVLGFSLLVEGTSFGVAIRGVLHDAAARGLGVVAHLRTTGDPFGVAVLLEDLAAVVGILIAALALALVHFTHDPRWDGIGSIAVGILLGAVAVFLIAKNKAMLVGKAAAEAPEIAAFLEGSPLVEAVKGSAVAITGVDSLEVRAHLDLDGAVLAARYLEGKDLSAIGATLADGEALRAFLAEYTEGVLRTTGAELALMERDLQAQFPAAKRVDLRVE